MTHLPKLAAIVSLGLLAAACAEADNTDERVVDETAYESPADVELPEIPVETPAVDTNGDGVIEGEMEAEKDQDAAAQE